MAKAEKPHKYKGLWVKDGMIIYVESPNEPTKRVLLELTRKFNKVAKYNYYVIFLYIRNE